MQVRACFDNELKHIILQRNKGDSRSESKDYIYNINTDKKVRIIKNHINTLNLNQKEVVRLD